MLHTNGVTLDNFFSDNSDL